ncbi:helix-turn-helix domain-containing protein [Ruminococcaceae bacterium OttesenSCG-928-A16]|nr:helix-turn-helix domain-containing protein [Ruminococcaceae bacterium OttesenSCG-928-A16]
MNIPKDTDVLKQIFSENLNRLMGKKNKSIPDVSADLDIPYTTVVSWARGEKYPRMDKVQALADYFHVSKSELIEDQKEKPAISKDDELNEYLEELRNRPEKRMFFSLTKDATKEEVETAVRIVDAFMKSRGMMPPDDD